MKKKKDQISETFKENLKTRLSSGELSECAQQLSEKYIEHEQHEADKKSVTGSFKSKMDILAGEMKELSQKVSTQHEWRDVQCHWKFNFTTDRKQLIRLDTGVIVRDEKITDADRQKVFKAAGTPDKKPTTKKG